MSVANGINICICVMIMTTLNYIKMLRSWSVNVPTRCYNRRPGSLEVCINMIISQALFHNGIWLIDLFIIISK